MVNIRQLVEVARIVLIGKSKNPKNGMEGGVLEGPMYLSVQMVATKSDCLVFAFQINASEVTKEF